MRMKRFICVVLMLIAITSCFGVSAAAAWTDDDMDASVATRASGKFSMEVAANKTVKAKTSFPLEVGEVVTIKASYSPSDCLFTGGVSIGEDRVPISQLSGRITMTAADNDPLSLIIDILDSCGIRYEIPIDALDTIFTSKVMTTPISPTINETIRLVELIPNDFDISESISVEIIFGDQDDAFSSLGNA